MSCVGVNRTRNKEINEQKWKQMEKLKEKNCKNGARIVKWI